MEDVPEKILTTNFLVILLNYNINNIKSFTNEALERVAPMDGSDEKMKFWEYAILSNGHLISDIPLNDERVNFFISHYPEGSPEYRISFQDVYSMYLRTKA